MQTCTARLEFESEEPTCAVPRHPGWPSSNASRNPCVVAEHSPPLRPSSVLAHEFLALAIVKPRDRVVALRLDVLAHHHGDPGVDREQLAILAVSLSTFAEQLDAFT